MNKKKFKNELDRARKKGVVSVYFLENLFKNEKKSFFNNEKIENLISENFSIIMDSVHKGNKDTIIDALYNHESMRPFLEKEETIKYILDSITYHDFESVIYESALKDKAQQYVRDNFDYIISNYPLKKIIPIYRRMELNEDMKEKIDRYLNKNKEKFLSEILSNTLSFRGKLDKKQLDTLMGIVTPIVDKILEKENCDIVNSRVVFGGAFSSVLIIGDNVIKVGIPRKTFNIPNDKRILQPYLRRDLSEEQGIEAVIEVSDRVDTDINLSEEELYAIYKEMRDRGIVCGDFKYNNIGKLIKDNPPRNNAKNGMIGVVSETLKVGDYVILDTDLIYNEKDPNIVLDSDMSRRFENMYQKKNIKIGR